MQELGIQRIIPREQLFCREDIKEVETFINRILYLMERLFISKGLTEKEAKSVEQVIYPVINIEAEANVYQSEDLTYIPNRNINFFSFDHYVDEFQFVINKTNHLIRQGEAKKIGIVYPLNRLLRVGTVEQFIYSSLKNLNLLVPNQLFSICVADLKKADCNFRFDYVFFLDINSMGEIEELYKKFIQFINNCKKNETNIVLTANNKTSLTEKIKNRLAKR
ncbi:hypothetical protein [Anoxybacillus flavithermus]|uniref:Uncharacterized protein n=1 Tax=Anoxybacillus flavithermus AK1 TaxID=1297581 RepID=M8DK56_9BACL|nr:hypothetical protein [Anoxybacillus flavithermus]EMT44765.1 hypothetical protein H919_13640 [Anoxybacillus flavithermus AK1]